MADIEMALALALRAHAGQVDKGGAPYILHPLRVAMPFAQYDDLFAIAILHDVVEDTRGKPDEITVGDIYNKFGPVVAAGVDALTRRPNEDYLKDFIPRCAQNPLAKAVKRADIADNLDPSRVLKAGNGERLRSRYHKALAILDK